jgi:hypothetical protein
VKRQELWINATKEDSQRVYNPAVKRNVPPIP